MAESHLDVATSLTTGELSLDALNRIVSRLIDEWAVPGFACAITDSERTLMMIESGVADCEAGLPVTRNTLFQIGSASKVCAALAVLREVESGHLELDRPVTEYLPWLPIRVLEGRPVTLHHLLSHTGGISRGMESSPTTVGELLALGKAPQVLPGRYYYSNAGYAIVGLVLEQARSSGIGDVLGGSVLRPAGMSASTPTITSSSRLRLAIGYVPADDGRPWHPRNRLAPAPWLESDTAAGSICSTIEDMASLCRVLLRRGKPIISPESFHLLTTPAADCARGAYGYGIEIRHVGSQRVLGHDGATLGYTASLDVLPDMGIGVVALCNQFIPPVLAPRLAVDAIRGFLLGDVGRSDPGQLDGPQRPPSQSLLQYCGAYRGSQGHVTVEEKDRSLWLHRGGEHICLEYWAEDTFYPQETPSPDRLVRFGRDQGVVVELTSGAEWYFNDRYTGLTQFAPPECWTSCLGTYRSHNPWNPGFRVLLRKGQLVLAALDDHVETRLVPTGEIRFRTEGDVVPSELAFADSIGGRTARAVFNGVDYFRSFTD